MLGWAEIFSQLHVDRFWDGGVEEGHRALPDSDALVGRLCSVTDVGTLLTSKRATDQGGAFWMTSSRF